LAVLEIITATFVVPVRLGVGWGTGVMVEPQPVIKTRQDTTTRIFKIDEIP
jgi:hypothetical protein